MNVVLVTGTEIEFELRYKILGKSCYLKNAMKMKKTLMEILLLLGVVKERKESCSALAGDVKELH